LTIISLFIGFVLLFSIWHPDLSDKEILAIKRAFNYRQSWLEQRYVGS
jgi:hypothetical protein